MERSVAGFTDTHAHLSFLAERGIEAGAYLDALFADGFGFALDIGTNAGDLAARISAFAAYPNVRFAAGVWPYKDQIARVMENAAALEAQLDRAPAGRVAAIGECGFDRRENPGEGAEETAFLEMQLALARRRNLPVIIHSREAAARTLEAVRRFPGVRCVIHCFSYTVSEARAFLDLGCFISFAGNLTFKNAAPLRKACAFVPAERLLLETDCPYLAPVPWRGAACHPRMIAETYQTAAAARGESLDALRDQVGQNARGLFGW